MASFPYAQRLSKCSATAGRSRVLRNVRLAIVQDAALSAAARDTDVAYLELAALQGDRSVSRRTPHSGRAHVEQGSGA